MEVLDSNKLHLKYGKFVKKVAKSMYSEYFWGLDLGEAEQIAWIAVISNYPKYVGFSKEGRPVKFESYISHRIKGAIIDEVRKRTCVRKSVDRKRFFVSKSMRSLEDMSTCEYEEVIGVYQDPEEFTRPSFDEIAKPLHNSQHVNILRLIYVYELSAVRISTIYGLTESRVSQIHKESLKKLRWHKEKYGI